MLPALLGLQEAAYRFGSGARNAPGRRIWIGLSSVTLLVVSHGGVMRTLDRHTGADVHPVPNLGGRWFTLLGENVKPGEAIVLHHGDRPAGVAL